MLILMISAIAFSFAYMVNDIKDYYPNSETNISSWEGKYDYYDNLSGRVNDIQAPLEALGDENNGWKVFTAVAAIPKALISFVSVGISSLGNGKAIITDTFNYLNLPPYLILIVLVMITFWGLIKFLEGTHRWPF